MGAMGKRHGSSRWLAPTMLRATRAWLVRELLSTCQYFFEGMITDTLFNQLNLKKILSYMSALKMTSPRHKFRFSDQVWLRQDKTADQVLRKLHER